jgi:outer membrane protein OmpA-like peptidoglycan-associated protein
MNMNLTKSIGFALLIGFLPVTACQTTRDQQAGQQQASDRKEKEKSGTAIGAAGGAAAGAAIGKGNERGRNAIIGGILGGIAGNRIGAYMDRQEEELKDNLEGSGVEVKREGNRIELNMPGDITFATGKSNVQSEFEPVLNSVSQVLKKYPETRIQVQGFTDNTGSSEFNQMLSEQRARSVASYFERNGIAGERVTTVGFGESQPIAENDTAEGRQQNRRVEIEVVPAVAEAD